MNDNNSIQESRRGFTLIELLLVISVMIVLAAMVIPKLRVVTADRKIREAARVVESMFATARDDAMVNGFAGIEIVRNPNYANGATSLFRMRMLPPYAGDFAGDTVSVTGFAPDLLDPQIQIGTLSFTSPPSVVLNENDYIQFNHGGSLYRMRSATSFEVSSHQVAPPVATGLPLAPALPFKIFRQPQRVTSSEVRVPAGQIIDLRGTGDNDTSGGPATLNGALNPVPLPSPNGNSYVITFNRHGAIDLHYPQGLGASSSIPAGPLFVLIADDQDAEGIDPLQNMNNLWVTVNQTNGAVNTSEMGSNTSQAAPFFPAASARMGDSRALALKRLNPHQ